MADDTDDVRQAAFLRYRFQDDAPSSIWGYLLKVGWKYKPGEGYQAPNSSSYLSGNEVLRMLDETSIVPIDNFLQLSPKIEKITNPESEALRRELINSLPINELLKAMGTKTSSKDTPSESIELPPMDFHSRPRRVQPSRKGKSVTNFDAGADLFLRPPKKKTKITSSPSCTTKQKVISEMEFPSARTIADYYLPLNLRGLSYSYKQAYQEWKFLLTTNHSLLLYGFGSKRELMNDFRSTCLESVGDVLSINGYDSSAHIKDVFELMIQLYCSNKDPSGSSTASLSERAKAIGKTIATVQLRRKQPLYLLIHNIDGFRTREAHHALSLLLTHSEIQESIRTIRLVASVDHVNASIQLWDPEAALNFNFIWKEVHTFEPYLHELQRGMEQTKSRQGGLAKNAVSATTDSINEVLSTIAPRPTEVLQLLAGLQLKHSSAISFRDLYQACKAKCLVISDGTLREYMTELLTHGLMEKSRSKGTEYFKIPHSRAILKNIEEYTFRNIHS